MKKTLLIILCTIIACSCVMGGTLAYLMAETKTVKNTFTIGSISIAISETKGDNGEVEEGFINKTFKMSPGATIPKDPTVSVLANSEACWLFVKLEKSTNFDTFLEYTIAAGWTELTTGSGIYWRAVDATTTDPVGFDVLLDNQVTVKDTITNDQAKSLIEAGNFPTLSVTAYAVQKDSVVDSQTEAWAILNPTT